MNLLSRLPSWSSVHRAFARLHGADTADDGQAEVASSDLVAAYKAYAEATLRASAALEQYGKASPQFSAADVASMRLFHRVKKMQGLKKAKSS